MLDAWRGTLTLAGCVLSRYQTLTMEDLVGAGLPPPVADMMWQMYSYIDEFGCPAAIVSFQTTLQAIACAACYAGALEVGVT